MKIRSGLAILILTGWGSQAIAGIRPSFSLQDSAWHATDVVVVAGGEPIDGNVGILEVWKGGLKAGEKIFVTGLAAFAPETARAVTIGFGDRGQHPAVHVTGSRMVLFLNRQAGNPAGWGPANLFKDMSVAVVWVDQGRTYSFVQKMNPGPSVLTPLDLSEQELKAQAGEIIRTQAALAATSALGDLRRRAQALRPYTDSKFYFARQEAFVELPKCGESALPVLRAMLDEKTLADRQGDVVEALGKAGGTAVGPELTKLVETETEFWKKMAPGLKQGWWNGTGLQWPEVEALRNRYSRVLSALYALKRLEFRGCERSVTQLREFWRSVPQLDDPSGLNEMSAECDHVLNALNPTKRQ